MIQIHITFEITIYFLYTIFFHRFDLIELRRKNLPPNKRLSKRKNKVYFENMFAKVKWFI